jgi:radical SAM superfamily enzyme YgiQ (UPF0313 family)
MKLTLINPRSKSPFDGSIPSPALATLAHCYSRKFDISVIDQNMYDSDESFLDEFSFSEPLIVGVTCTIDNFTTAMQLCETLKEKSNDVTIIIGGPHVSLLGRTNYQFPNYIDIVVLGEGEGQVAQISRILKSNSQAEGPVVLVSSPFDGFGDCSNMTWDKCYLRDKHVPFFNYESARGCSYGCLFCAHPVLAGKKLRTKESRTVVEQLSYCKSNFDVSYFRFTDSNFTSPKHRFKEICRDIDSLDLHWSCFARAEDLDIELIDDALKAGCVGMFVGVESAEEKRLTELNKVFSRSKFKEILRYSKSKGLLIFCNFIHGLPGDDLNSALSIIEMINDMEITYFNVTPFHLVPDSPYVTNASKWGLTIYDPWPNNLHRSFDGGSVDYFRTSELSQYEMRENISFIKSKLPKQSIYWNLRDYKLLFWMSLGGTLESLKKIWEHPEKQLSGFELVCFKEFRERGSSNFTLRERTLFKDILKSIAISSVDTLTISFNEKDIQA